MIPVVVIGGYLGAGKTTLVNQILSGRHGRRVTVLVNDFGSVNIDAELIDNRDGDTISLSNGCACCTIGNDLLAAADQATSVTPAPEIVLIEASGAAEPARMAVNLLGVASLQAARLLTVVDGSSIIGRLRDKFVGHLARRQIGQAHQLLINRTEPERLAELMQTIAPHAAPPLADGEAALEWILNVQEGAALQVTPDEMPDHGLRAVHLMFDGAVSKAHFNQCQAVLPESVHRVKGFLPVFASERAVEWLEVQYAGGRWDLRPVNQRESAELVIIGTFDGSEEEALRHKWTGV